MKIYGSIGLYGPKDVVDEIALHDPLRPSRLSEIGIKNQKYNGPKWFYGTSIYRFRQECINEEIQDFLTSNFKIADFISEFASKVEMYALSIFPIAEVIDECFSSYFNTATLTLLNEMHLALEISPEAWMNDFEWWQEKGLRETF